MAPLLATAWLLLAQANAWSTSHPCHVKSVHLASSKVTNDPATSADKIEQGQKRKWFPIHPADALSTNNDYNAIVKSAYVRHCLVETEEMADLILGLYVGGGAVDGESSLVLEDDDGKNFVCPWTDWFCLALQ
jgi:hypothetical protein